MARIYFVDDDYGTELVSAHFRDRGHDVTRLSTIEDALSRLSDIAKADLLVLDLIMPEHQARSERRPDGENSTGLRVYREVRKITTDLPILVYTANQDAAIAELIRSDDAARYVSRWGSPEFKEFVGLVYELVGLGPSPAPLRPFIVHGHDEATKLQVKDYLQNILRLPEPIILHEQPSLGRTIIEKFEDYAEGTELVFVILTPDDIVAGPNESDETKRRARQNVILELGFFLGVLGRRSGRVFLLYKGPVELPSDIAGVLYLDITNGIAAVSDQVRQELEAVRQQTRIGGL